MTSSHETIYRSLSVPIRGVLPRELVRHLPAQRHLRPSGRRQPSRRGQIPDAIFTRERPPEMEVRAIPGHWVGDLLVGANSGQITTRVKRASRFTVLVQVPCKEAETVRKTLATQIRRLPQ